MQVVQVITLKNFYSHFGSWEETQSEQILTLEHVRRRPLLRSLGETFFILTFLSSHC